MSTRAPLPLVLLLVPGLKSVPALQVLLCQTRAPLMVLVPVLTIFVAPMGV